MFIPIHDANRLQHIGLQWGTLALIAANLIVFILEQTPLWSRDLTAGLGLIPITLMGSAARVEEIALIPEPLTLLTYTFVHADFLHLLGNMLFLWVFGDNVEDAVGHLRFILFYVLCGIGAGLLHAVVQPESGAVLIGASGAVAGVIAAYLILHPKVWVWFLFLSKIPLRLPAFLLLGAWIALQLFYAFTEGDVVVAWWAHVGGAAMGAILIFVLRRSGTPLFDRGLTTARNAPQPEAQP
ncbi:MAG: rhomboid family intramembrane serine protease [Bauldia sp.]